MTSNKNNDYGKLLFIETKELYLRKDMKVQFGIFIFACISIFFLAYLAFFKAIIASIFFLCVAIFWIGMIIWSVFIYYRISDLKIYEKGLILPSVSPKYLKSDIDFFLPFNDIKKIYEKYDKIYLETKNNKKIFIMPPFNQNITFGEIVEYWKKSVKKLDETSKIHITQPPSS